MTEPRPPWRHLLGVNLRLLIVGFNPSLHSGRLGHFYAYRGNMFWRLLFEAGLVPVPLRPEEDARLLDYDIGLMDLSDRPTASAQHLSPAERSEGRRRVEFVVRALLPRYVACTGKGVYQVLAPGRRADYGLNPSPYPPPTELFVLPSPSGRSGLPYREKLRYYRDLADRIRSQVREAEAGLWVSPSHEGQERTPASEGAPIA